nr:hypothetical protein [Tanacetum cinerariifolium]
MSSLFADTYNVVAILEKSDAAEEVVIREILQLADAEGVVCLPNEEIFAGLAQMGYEKPAKRTSWNEFSMTMASAVICLSKGVETPLFEGMLAARQPVEEGLAEAQVQADDAVAAAVEENKLEIIKLQARVKRLERDNKVMSLKLRRLRKDADFAETEWRHAAKQAEK